MISPIIAAGGVVFRIAAKHKKPKILLIFRSGFWDLPKGKLENGESIPMCAVREVAEETGSDLPIIVTYLGTTYHEYLEQGRYFGKTTYWYSMVFSSSKVLAPQKSEKIEKIEWVDLEKAIKKVGFDNLRNVLSTFQQEMS